MMFSIIVFLSHSNCSFCLPDLARVKLRIKTKRSQFSVEGGEEGNTNTAMVVEEEKTEENKDLLSSTIDQQQAASGRHGDMDTSKELMAGGQFKLSQLVW